jgi:hypothetical protein
LCPKCTELAYTCICQFKNFPGLYPRTAVLKRRGGKANGRVGVGGMEWEGKKDEGEGEGKERREGEVREGV